MSSTNAPFGLICARSAAGQSFAREFTIATGYAVNLFEGDPVKFVDTDGGGGTLELATSDGTRSGTVTGIPVLGVFKGCEYIDATGKPVVSNYWPASTTATNIKAYVYEGTLNEFIVQADGAVAAADVGSQTDLTGFSTGGSTTTGRSIATVSATPVASGTAGQFTILEIYRTPDNAAGDSYTQVLVRINAPQLGQTTRAALNT